MDGKSCCTPNTDLIRHAAPTPGTAAPGKPDDLPVKFVDVPTAERIDKATEGSTDGMVRLEGGTFLMGTDSDERWEADGEGPVREVTVAPFYIDATTVTNEQFARFIKETGYETDADKFGWSFVHQVHLKKGYVDKLRKSHAVPGLQWWIAVPGAKWDKPEGDRSNIKQRMDHPVTQVSWNDAVAYCRWAGKRLAREAEWEFAARGGKEQAMYPWGDVLEPRGKHVCNIWQGKFPDEDSAEDGFSGTCPADHFPPNGFGLYNVSGNVWEWTNDWFCPHWHQPERCETRKNPMGPKSGTHKLQKGGSFLCHHSYCNRYRVAARSGNMPDSATANAGFRCVRDV